MTKMIRCFISIDVKDEEIIKKIEKLQNEILGKGIKNVELNNLHFTLKFLGDITPEILEEINNVIQTIRFKEFTLALHSVGMFPNANKPRVYWIGVSAGQQEMEKISLDINTSLKDFGFPIDRKFKSHLTIARIKRFHNATISNLKKTKHLYQNELFGNFKVSTVSLKKSTLTPEGPIYETISRVKSNG